MFCLEAYCGSDYSTNKTMYVGASITLNPKSDCNADYCHFTGITYDTEAFLVEKIAQTNSLGSQVVNGSSTGTYYNFKLTALKAGTFSVTCRVQYYGSSSGYKSKSNKATYTITVKEVPKVVSISIPSTLTLSIGNTYTFSPTIYEAGASTTLTWSSSNSNVVSVSGKTITAKNVGTATITCKATNGVTAKCVVTVTPILIQSITLQVQSYELKKGIRLHLIPKTITPTNATNKVLRWTSSDETIATVELNPDYNDYRAIVTTHSVGVCTITAHATDGSGAKGTCVVTVLPIEVSDITLNETATDLLEGEHLQLTATVSPVGADNKTVKWSSSDPSVAEVDDNGYVTALSIGNSTITATAADGSGVEKSCNINVTGGLLYTDDAITVPSGSFTLPIHLRNTASIAAFQLELALPDGVSVATNEAGKMKVRLSERATDHTLSCSLLSNGNYQLVALSGNAEPFSGNSGAIAYVTLDVTDDTAVGDYAISIKNVELTTIDSQASHQKDGASKLTIKEVAMGDANGDNAVTVTDAVGIVNYILGRAPSTFIPKAADVNGDGEITITDAVGIVNTVLNH